MRTTLNLDDALMADLMKRTGERKKTRAVMQAIEEFVLRKRREEAVALMGTFHFDRTWKQMKADERAAERRKERLWNRIRRARS